MTTTTKIKLRPASSKLKGLWRPRRLKILRGGRGSGKSMAVAEYIIARATTAKIRVLCCREIQKSIKESAHQLLAETIERLGLSAYWQVLEREIRCLINGSEIIFEGMHRNLTKIKGIQGVSIAWVEEAESCSQESFDVLFPTLRLEGSEIIITFNPRFTTDAAYKLSEQHRDDMWVCELNWDDNPFFPEVLRSEMEHCKATDFQKYSWIWLGRPMGQEGNAFIQAALIHEAKNRMPTDDLSAPLVMGLDVARYGKDFSVAVGVRGKRIVFHERVHGLDTPTLAEWARSLYYQHQPAAIVVDAAGSPGCFDVLNAQIGQVCKVIPFNGANAAIQTEYHNARIQSWAYARDWLRDGGALTQDDCWHEAESVTFCFTPANKKLLEPKEMLKKRIGKSPDDFDALTMALWPPAIQAASKTEEEATFEQYQYDFAG